jgi:PBP1b-binding outer membrane lipoprotein LpoB
MKKQYFMLPLATLLMASCAHYDDAESTAEVTDPSTTEKPDWYYAGGK